MVKLDVERDESGELAAASYDLAGNRVSVEITRQKQRQASSVAFEFSERGQLFLALRGSIEHRTASLRRVATLVASDGDGRVLYDLGVRHIAASPDSVRIKKRVAGRVYAGTLDPRSLKTAGLEKSPGWLESLSPRQVKRVNPFLPEFKSMASFYAPQSSVAFLGVQGFSAGSVCRAACWGIAAYAAAACCAQSPRGCAACSAVFAAVASLCSDGCPP